ncbi:uncharacterized protein LOC102450756 isoform X3 [Pelodiscus sinensis]|uniref:uncharacterized protein LOC102450756 isoform X3 n=1 Tax=Pelodiscus sinensis TaxID=13735 RepID=UPI003F6D4C0A
MTSGTGSIRGPARYGYEISRSVAPGRTRHLEWSTHGAHLEEPSLLHKVLIVSRGLWDAQPCPTSSRGIERKTLATPSLEHRERSNTGRSGSKPDTWQPYQGDLPPAGPLLPGQARSGFAERRAPLAATCSWERRRLAATGPELAMKSVFVTVGTTCFEELIAVVSTPETIQILQSLGYSRLVLQVGGGAAPTPLRTPAFTLEVFRFRESLAEEFQRADLVISHAGAGTCLETLEKGKPLLVVINEKLMNNHQLELARQLYKDEHLFYCTSPFWSH